MRRALAILFDAAAALSLALCVAAVGFWVSSYSHRYTVGADDGNTEFTGVLSRGELGVRIQRAVTPDTSRERGGVELSSFRGPAGDLLREAMIACPGAHPPVIGFFFGRQLRAGMSRTIVALPMSFLVVLLVGLTLVMVRSRVRRRRRARRLAGGRCVGCGYDLRATPEKCPECGRESATVAVNSPLDVRP